MKYLMTAALLGLTSMPAAAAELSLDFTGLKADTGTLMIALYNDPARFLKQEGIVAHARLEAGSAELRHIFKDLEPGRYAVSAFHDVNGSGVLEKGAFGIPKEPVGMSNDARGSFGPPSFDDAVFDLPEGGLSLTIKLD